MIGPKNVDSLQWNAFTNVFLTHLLLHDRLMAEKNTF